MGMVVIVYLAVVNYKRSERWRLQTRVLRHSSKFHGAYAARGVLTALDPCNGANVHPGFTSYPSVPWLRPLGSGDGGVHFGGGHHHKQDTGPQVRVHRPSGSRSQPQGHKLQGTASGHSFRAQIQGTASGHIFKAQLQGTDSGHSSGDTAQGHSSGAQPKNKLQGHRLRAQLKGAAQGTQLSCTKQGLVQQLLSAAPLLLPRSSCSIPPRQAQVHSCSL